MTYQGEGKTFTRKKCFRTPRSKVHDKASFK